MNLKRYRVTNIQEALQLIKRDLGPEAIIVSTRQVKEGRGTFGLFGKTVLEVTAARDDKPKATLSSTLGRISTGNRHWARRKSFRPLRFKSHHSAARLRCRPHQQLRRRPPWMRKLCNPFVRSCKGSERWWRS